VLLGNAIQRSWVVPAYVATSRPLEPVAHRYRAGDDEDDIAYAIEAMRELRAELRRRTRVIRELPHDLCPESKDTAQLASNRTLGLYPIVVGVDECQVWFEHSPRPARPSTLMASSVLSRTPIMRLAGPGQTR
jgi:DNA segregation ATPase FtsK/SpoIIIE, S-DNA-T family